MDGLRKCHHHAVFLSANKYPYEVASSSHCTSKNTYTCLQARKGIYNHRLNIYVVACLHTQDRELKPQ